MEIHTNLFTVPLRRLAQLMEEKSGPGIPTKTAFADSVEQVCQELEHFVKSGKANKVKVTEMTVDHLKR